MFFNSCSFYSFKSSVNSPKFSRLHKKLKQLFITIVLIALVVPASFAENCVNWDPGTFVPNTNTIGQKLPSYGLYWVKADGSADLQQSVMQACKFADPKCQQTELANGFFDPNKPTIIFIHGWQPDTVKNKDRFDFCYSYSNGQGTMSTPMNVLTAWKGYNIAVFYWNQFADDTLYAAEAKIYSTQGSHGMSWKYLDNSGVTHDCQSGDLGCVMPKESVTDMAFDAYSTALPQTYTQELRIVGHSLGAQIAIQLTQRVMLRAPLLAQPTRLVLLDPYFSQDGYETAQNNLPNSVADYNNQTVTDIVADFKTKHPSSAGFPIEVYRTSTASYFPLGNPAWALMNQATYMRVYPLYIQGLSGNSLNVAEHIASTYLYFYSKGFVPATTPDVTNLHVDAASTDAQVLQLTGQKRYQEVSILDRPSYQSTWLSKFTNLEPIDPEKR